MNNINVTYKGDVVIRLAINGKIITLKTHNEGTDSLKKGICMFLSGHSTGKAYSPQTLDLRRYKEGEPEEGCLNQEIELTGKTYLHIDKDEDLGIENNWVARFNAAVPCSAITKTITDADGYTYRFILCGDYDENDPYSPYHDLATIDVAAGDLERIKPGTQALIEWNMQILNPSEVK